MDIKINETVKEYLFDQLKRHGLPFIMLGVATWFFYEQFIDLQKQVDDCNAAIIELYSHDHIQMREVIIENTKAIEKLLR